jgi:hypothetical protein
LRIAGHVVLGAVLGAVLGLALAGAFGGAVQYLWNHVLTAVVPVSGITYFQAVGLLVLARLLFGSFGGRGRHHGWFGRHGREHGCCSHGAGHGRWRGRHCGQAPAEGTTEG